MSELTVEVGDVWEYTSVIDSSQKRLITVASVERDKCFRDAKGSKWGGPANYPKSYRLISRARVPPLPAAPVHMAREAGQRYQFPPDGEQWTLVRKRLPGEKYPGEWDATYNDGRGIGILDEQALATMTLLSAPKAEAAKLCVCDQQNDEPHSPHCPVKPAAVEKGPACCNCGLGPSLMRVAGGYREPRQWCTDCYLRWEANINTDGLTNVLDNTAIPERLPRPRLAHAAGLSDDELTRETPKPFLAAARCGQVLSSPTSLAFAMGMRDTHERQCPNCQGTDAVSKIWRKGFGR